MLCCEPIQQTEKSLRRGEVIKGFRVLTDPTNASGGQCQWSFAERDGREYFIKQFLTPKYPTPDSPGSAATKEKKQAACLKFEDHHRKLMGALKDLSAKGGGGNLITAVELFLWGTTYFKITEKVDVASVGMGDIARRALRDRLLLVVTVSHSVELLHRKSIVHGDLKPPNVLVKVTPKGDLTTKLIDFDNAFFANEPPANPEDVVGDFAYYSPELYRYVVGGGDGSSVGTPSDIFALGLIFTQYLTGQLPELDGESRYACVAVESGGRVRVPDAGMPESLHRLLESMLEHDPAARPTVSEIFHFARDLRSKEPEEESRGWSTDTVRPATEPEPVGGRLRGLDKFTSSASPSAAMPDEGRSGEPAGELRGLEKFKKRRA